MCFGDPGHLPNPMRAGNSSLRQSESDRIEEAFREPGLFDDEVTEPPEDQGCCSLAGDTQRLLFFLGGFL